MKILLLFIIVTLIHIQDLRISSQVVVEVRGVAEHVEVYLVQLVQSLHGVQTELGEIRPGQLTRVAPAAHVTL